MISICLELKNNRQLAGEFAYQLSYVIVEGKKNKSQLLTWIVDSSQNGGFSTVTLPEITCSLSTKVKIFFRTCRPEVRHFHVIKVQKIYLIGFILVFLLVKN